jgi:methyl-accepting chemotaxis protein
VVVHVSAKNTSAEHVTGSIKPRYFIVVDDLQSSVDDLSSTVETMSSTLDDVSSQVDDVSSQVQNVCLALPEC